MNGESATQSDSGDSEELRRRGSAAEGDAPEAEVRKDSRKKRLFQIYSRNLAALAADGLVITAPDPESGSRVTGNPEDFYVCPICLKVLHRCWLDTDGSPNSLTVEHVPPKAASRRLRRTNVLTCSECNSEKGASAESHLKEALQMADLERDSQSSVRCQLHIADLNLHARWSVTGGNAQRFVVGPNVMTPRVMETLRDYVRQRGSQPISFEAQLKLPDERLVRTACLKAAYLTLFHFFGYSYVLLCPTASYTRGQLLHPESAAIPREAVIPLPGLRTGLNPPAILVVREPTELRSFVVILQLRANTQDHFWACFLPGPLPGAECLYESLQVQAKARPTLQVRYEAVDLEQLSKEGPLTDQSQRHAVHQIWNQIIRD